MEEMNIFTENLCNLAEYHWPFKKIVVTLPHQFNDFAIFYFTKPL